MQRTKLCTRAHMLAQSGPDWPNMDQSGVAAVFAVKDTDSICILFRTTEYLLPNYRHVATYMYIHRAEKRVFVT